MPLAIIAAIVSRAWMLLPVLAVCAWWWSPRDTGWEWLTAVGRGLLGAEWALLGCGPLMSARGDDVWVVGGCWMLGALLLAALGRGAERSRSEPRLDENRGGEVLLRRSGAPTFRRGFAMHLATTTTLRAVKRDRR